MRCRRVEKPRVRRRLRKQRLEASSPSEKGEVLARVLQQQKMWIGLGFIICFGYKKCQLGQNIIIL